MELAAEAASAASAGPPPVLMQGVDLEVRGGECVVVVGANGIGKSSLLRAMNGEAGSLAGGERRVGSGVRLFSFGQDAAERLEGEQTAAEELMASALLGESHGESAGESGGESGGASGGASDEGSESGDGDGDGSIDKQRTDRVYRVMKQLGIPPSVQHTSLDDLSGGEKGALSSHTPPSSPPLLLQPLLLHSPSLHLFFLKKVTDSPPLHHLRCIRSPSLHRPDATLPRESAHP